MHTTNITCIIASVVRISDAYRCSAEIRAQDIIWPRVRIVVVHKLLACNGSFAIARRIAQTHSGKDGNNRQAISRKDAELLQSCDFLGKIL